MGKLITSTQAATRLEVTLVRVQALCRQRRIPGARLIGRTWMLPEDFEIRPGARGPKLKKAKRDANSLKSGSVEIQHRGKTYTGEYVVARGVITVIGENGSKTAQLGAASAEAMATDLLREIVDENKAN